MATTIADAYVQIMPSMRGIEGNLSSTIGASAAAAGSKAGKLAGSNLGMNMFAAVKGYRKQIIGVVSAIGVGKFAKDSINAFSDLALQTKQLQRIAGGTALEVSSMAGAMRLSGMDTSKANRSLTIFAKNLDKAGKGSKTQAEAFKNLGVSVTDASGKMKSMHQMLPEIADKFKEMPDGASKTAAAVALFGRNGTAMLPFLNKGSAGIAELEKKAQELGITLDDQSMTTWANYRSSIRTLQVALDGLKVTAGAALAPFVTDVVAGLSIVVIPALKVAADGIKQFMGGLTGAIDTAGFSAAMDGIKSDIDSVFGGENGEGVKNAGEAIGKVVNGLVNVLNGARPFIALFAQALKFVADNANIVVPALMGVFLAMKGAKAARGLSGALSGIGSAMSKIAGKAGGAAGGLLATAGAERTAGSASKTSAKSILAGAAAVIALGVGVVLCAAGMWILSDAAIRLSSAGIGAVVTLILLGAAIAGLAFVFSSLGPALNIAVPGMLAFGVAVLLVGAGVALASLGISMLADKLPIISQFGLSAALGITAIGAAALVAGIGLIPLAIFATLASIGMLALGVASIVAGIGMLLLAASVPIVSSGMMILAVALPMVAMGALMAAPALLALSGAVLAASVPMLGLSGSLMPAAGAMMSFAIGAMIGVTSLFAIAGAAGSAGGSLQNMGGTVTSVSGTFGQLQSSAFASLDAITGKVRATASAIQAALSRRFEFRFNQNIKLPHFKMTGDFDAKTKKVPSVSVDWYATGAVFSSPSLIGVGDATSPEIITPQTMMENTFEGVLSRNKNDGVVSEIKALREDVANLKIFLDTGELVGGITREANRVSRMYGA